jgi:membrane protein
MERILAIFRKWWLIVQRNPLFRGMEHWARTHSLPGLQRIPLYSLGTFILKELRNDRITTRANSMAFSFFLALFPTIIVLITLLAYTPLRDVFDDQLNTYLGEIMPGDTGEAVIRYIGDILQRPRGSLLSFGFFLAIWFASNGMLSMMRGLEKDYPVFRKRGLLEKRLTAIQLTFLISFLLVASVVVGILGNYLGDALLSLPRLAFVTRPVLIMFRWVILILLAFFTFSYLYRYGVSIRHRMPLITPGGVMATILSILTSVAFSFYVDNFGRFNKVYGSIGTLIVLMIWIQFNCTILLLGFELNAGVAVLRHLRQARRGAEHPE